MGLIKSLVGSVGSVLADQWREYYYCDSIENDILLTKGQKRTSSRSSNTDGYENIISNGSIIAVADNQCMIIVDNGKVAEICAEPGEFTYDSSTEPTIFYGDLGTGIVESFKNIGKRFTFGAEAPKDQRVYFINTKEILENKYGTVNPVPFRFVDKNIGLDIDGSVKCHGEFSFKIIDPIKFYTNIAGNVATEYNKSQILGQLKVEILDALQDAFSKISAMGVRYSEMLQHKKEMTLALNELLSEQWGGLRGIEIVNFSVASMVAPDDIAQMIMDLQKLSVLKDPMMANARLTDATAEAMQAAAANESTGPMMAFAGMNMAGMAGGNAAGLTNNAFQMQQQQMQQQQMQQQQQQTQAPVASGWNCSCGGTNNTGKFCTQCGKPNQVGWNCECGNVNKGKFCSNCGKSKPADALLYKCDKCSWEPEDPKNPPKFCPECGDVFNEGDAKK